MKVYLSPSNQDGNIYAYGNTNEMEQCFLVAQYAQQYLTEYGYEVKCAPKGQNMYTSIRESNGWGADLHVCIHTNAFNGEKPGGDGTMVMVYENSGKRAEYAKGIYNAVQSVSPGTTDYGIAERQDLAEINSTLAIAVYVECEFHDEERLAKWIVENTAVLGKSIADGIYRADGGTSEETKYGATYKERVSIEINTLGVGDSGDDVKALQLLLIGWGYDIKYGADGRFGKITETSVKAFQRNEGITIDGIAGKETFSKLLKVL